MLHWTGLHWTAMFYFRSPVIMQQWHRYPSFTLIVSYAVTANISHFYKCLRFLYSVAVR